MKAFVTGGTGFVGSHLIEQLLERGAEVRCLVRDQAKADRLFPAGGFTAIPGDLENTRALEQGCEGVDVVFHVAAIVSARSDRHFHQINVDATARVLRAAQRGGSENVRFVYVSSLAAGGPVEKGTLLSDPGAQNPVTAYGRSKLEGEKMVRRSEIDWTILRPPAVYGPRDTEMFKLFKLVKTGFAPLFGDGFQQLSLIHVDDLATALIAAAGSECKQKTYYPAHREVITSRELAIEVFRAVRGEPEGSSTTPRVFPLPGPLTRAILWTTGTFTRAIGKTTLLTLDKANEFLAPAWTVDPGELENDTGWHAEVNVAAGTRTTAQWYRQNSWL